MDVDCDITRLIVRRLFNFEQDLAIFCDVKFGAILEKHDFNHDVTWKPTGFVLR
jgi:hypothetical protein